MMKVKYLALMTGIAVGGLVASGAFAPAQASTFTMLSPTSAGALPTGVSSIGGVVLDLIGINGNRIVAQTAANSLFTGTSSASFTIGTQSGFTTAKLLALGGGIAEASVRITVNDGDTATHSSNSTTSNNSGSVQDFDYNQNTLLLNGINFGNFTSVNAENTTSLGLSITPFTVTGNTAALTHVDGGFSGGGFRNNLLDTGFFYVTNATTLASLFTSLSGGSVTYTLNDVDGGDNVLNFPSGIDASLASVSYIPTASSSTAVPEPFTIIGTIMGGTAAMRMRKKLKSSTKA
jgi:hypothetical protein